jgi:phenylacetate-CoA ligase
MESGVGRRVGNIIDWLNGKVIWPLWSRRDDARLPKYVRELERRQFDSTGVIAARQAVMLNRVIGHARETVPYYRGLGFQCNDLAQFPLLSKELVREQSDRLISDAHRHEFLIEKKTSGSTGVPLRIRIDSRGMAWKRAATLRSDEWSGWTRGQSVAKAWGNPEYRHHGFKGWMRNQFHERAIHLDTLKMDDAALRQFANQLIRRRFGLIYGHAHSVYLVAQFLRDHGMTPKPPSGIITTAMVLHDFQRRLIEDVFHCPVTNRYGCEEVSLIACECPAHQGLHINVDSVFVEILANGQPVRPGQAGKIIITDLSNFAMPLIRYEVGDVASWADGTCPCGRPSPRLVSIEGREADYVVTGSGQLVSGISLTENFATLVPGIAQLQIIQERIDHFRFRIVRGPDFSAESERRIAQLVRERFGTPTRFTCEFVNRIPQEPSGKYRFCISHVIGDARREVAA